MATLIRGKKANYYITKTYLGGGAFGAVWKGYRESDEYPVAIKVIQIDKSRKEMIEKEVKLIGIVSQFPKCFPQIVCIHDYIPGDSVCYIIMELIIGETLEDLPKRKVPFALEEIATGLSFLHKNKIIHRDIKMENVLHTRDHVVIVDLGLGCSPDFDPKCEKMGGTVGYLDPLFYLGRIQTAQYSSDIFALGVTMYILLTNDYPNFQKFRTEEAMLAEYNRLREKLDEVDDFPSRLLDLISRMLNPTSAIDRPTADEILDIIKGVPIVREERKIDTAPLKAPPTPKLDLSELLFQQAKTLYKEDMKEDLPTSMAEDYIRLGKPFLLDKGLRPSPSEILDALKRLRDYMNLGVVSVTTSDNTKDWEFEKIVPEDLK